VCLKAFESQEAREKMKFAIGRGIRDFGQRLVGELVRQGQPLSELHSNGSGASGFWSGPADAVKIEILQNGKTAAAVPGQIKNLPRPAPYDSVATKTESDTRMLDEIEFNNRTDALVLGGE
jgi:hypothetical protein